jgi:uncharacterized protein YbaR (Trm112 family)
MSKNKNITKHQRKKSWPIFVIVIIILIVGGYFLLKKPGEKIISQRQCQVQEITFYYLDQCGWCQKVKSEGTIDKLEKLGVKVNKVNAAIGPIRHQFQAVPTFVINEKVYIGYKTFEELRYLLGCPKETEKSLIEQSQPNQNLSQIEFFGEKGETLNLENGEIKLAASIFNDNQARFYNVKMPDGKTIYFFIVKDKNGVYRTAANSCQVCFKTYKGFRQEGDEIVCNNCGNRYPIEKIATEKGGCNPGPINPNLEVKNGQIVVKQTDLEEISGLF